MDDKNIIAAMDDARRESHTIGVKLSEMEKLQQRKAQLDTFITQCQLLLGDVGQDSQTKPLFDMPSPEPRHAGVAVVDDISKAPNWEKARRIFIETNNKPMILSEMVKEFQKRGFSLSEKNTKQVVRMALKNRPDVFSVSSDDVTYTYWLKDYLVAAPSLADEQQ